MKLSPDCVVGHMTFSQNIMSFQLPKALSVKSMPTCGLCTQFLHLLLFRRCMHWRGGVRSSSDAIVRSAHS